MRRLFLLVLFLVESSCFRSLGHVAQENKLERQQGPVLKSLFRVCNDTSACGIVQKNPFGITSEELCSCSEDESCSLSWDANDGHTLSFGDTQVKWCSSPPQDLSPCTPIEVARRSRYLEKPEGYEGYDYLLCNCPSDYNFNIINSSDIRVDSNSVIYNLEYACQPFEICTTNELCQTIGKNGDQIAIGKICNCPDGLQCKDDIKLVTPTYNVKGVEFYDIYCES